MVWGFTELLKQFLNILFVQERVELQTNLVEAIGADLTCLA